MIYQWITIGPRLEEAGALGQTVEDLPRAAHALHFLPMVRLGEGDAAAGRSLGEQAVALARQAADAFCDHLARYALVVRPR